MAGLMCLIASKKPCHLPANLTLCPLRPNLTVHEMQRIVSEVPLRKALSSRSTVAALRIRFFVLNRVRPAPPMGIQSAPAFSTEGFPFETVALGRREAPKPWGGPTSEARGKRVTGQERRRGGGEKAIAATPSTAKRFSTKGVMPPQPHRRLSLAKSPI